MLMLKYALLSATVLMLVALGGCYSEHSGVINLALEGIMVIGGLMGAMMLNILPETMAAGLKVVLSIVVAAASGVLYSCLLAFSAINLKADQTIGGTALNLLSTAIAMVVVKRFNGTQSAKLSYDNSAFLFKIGGLTVNVFLIIGIVLLIAAYIVLYKTRFGLRLQACGEHPQAADSVGINVYRMRWSGVLISGFLAGIGGFAYIVPAVQTWNFEVGVAGMGFLALAVMIFGQWKPGKIALAAIFFAIFKSLANIYDSIGWLNALHLTKEMYNMMPFVASMVVLAFTSKKSRAPKAEGIPYDKGQR
jgi:simple sugar transport system permease protein